ncbi:MAG TPA: hypothetical protein VF193_00020 [Steroidobacter sp.]
MKASVQRSYIRVAASTDHPERALHEICSSDRDVRKEVSLAATKRIVARTLLRGVGLMLVVSLPVFLLWLDVWWLGNTVGEVSTTELSQISCLVLIMISFGYLARLSPEDRRFAVLTAGFFACMLIRELDAALDLLMNGLWQALVFLVAVTCLTYAVIDWRATLRGMARMMATRFTLVMTIGLALLLAYSRLLGMGLPWKEMLEDGYVRAVKNAVEESAELLGYALILVASIGYVGNRRLRLGRSRTRAARGVWEAGRSSSRTEPAAVRPPEPVRSGVGHRHRGR